MSAASFKPVFESIEPLSTKLLPSFPPLNQATKLALQTVDTAKYERRCQDPLRGTTRTKDITLR